MAAMTTGFSMPSTKFSMMSCKGALGVLRGQRRSSSPELLLLSGIIVWKDGASKGAASAPASASSPIACAVAVDDGTAVVPVCLSETTDGIKASTAKLGDLVDIDVDGIFRPRLRAFHQDAHVAADAGKALQAALFINQIRGIPTLDIIHYEPSGSGFGDFWHTHDDNMSGISKQTLNAVGETVFKVVMDL